jgi:DNA-binding MarR family transcriptional regulator
MPKIDPLTATWSDDEVSVMQSLRDWAVTFDELNRRMASWLGLPGSDANALGQIVWADTAGAPLSPAELSRIIGMTSGATTTLVNRLERAGHVTRHRESSDRRRVTLRPSPEALAECQRFLTTAGTEIASTVRETDPGEIRVAIAFLHRMTAAAAAGNARLAEAGTA